MLFYTTLDLAAKFTVTCKNELGLGIPFQYGSCNVDEINWRLLGFKTGDHSNDELAVRDTPIGKLSPARSRLHELTHRNRVATQNPVAAPEDAVLFSLLCIRIRNHNELRRDLRCD